MRYDRDWPFVLVITTLLAFGYTNGAIVINENEVTRHGEVEVSHDYRLPITIIPRSYDLKLQFPSDEKSSEFRGTTTISAIAKSRTKEIVFHAGNITINAIAVITDTQLTIKNKSRDSITEKYKVELEQEILAETEIKIIVVYLGFLRNDMIGFYRSSYIDNNGETKWLAATQFQATHARHAFPCFDEPNFKARFTVSILRPQKFSCLSNMPLNPSKSKGSDPVLDVFHTSPYMSTYLVAFVVSDFASLTDLKTNFTVWSRPNAIAQGEYALKIGPQALKILSELFDQEYQLEKMDMVAVPDFAAGAMENWGLITYRETRMLYDDNVSSASSQQDVASVIVHECVHMWFGNLVTPMWWGYLWLSEGFARYYQYMATAKIEPAWNMEQQFVVEQQQSVYAVDALDSSKPLSRNVSSQAEIGTTGDTITYSKGASVIRMMELTFGSEVFKSGLREYLKTKNYSSAVPEDLWSALQHQADLKHLKLGASIQEVMDTWTHQSGFPILSVKIVDGVASLHQERFLIRNPESANTNVTWWIPVTWTTQKNPNFISTSPKYWLGTESGNVKLSLDTEEWVIFNIQEAGFYRVNYDKDSWYRIFSVLLSSKFEDIHEVNRAAIVDDLLNLARAGYLDYDTALTGFDYIKRESNYLPFKAALTGLDYLNKRFAGQESYHYIEYYLLSVIEYIYNDMGFEDRVSDDRLTVLLRRELNAWACSFDQSDCVDRSLTAFSNWRIKSQPVSKNLRATAYCTVMRHGSPEDWDFLWKAYLESNVASDQLVILKALGCSRNTTILEKYLLRAVTEFEDSGIRKQDSTSAFSAVYGSGLVGAEYILEFIAKHHVAMEKYYGGYDTVATILSGASQRFSTDEHIVKFSTLIDNFSTDFKTISKSLQASLQLAKYELEWFKNNEDAIITWMKKNNKVELTTPSTTTSNENPPGATSTTTDNPPDDTSTTSQNPPGDTSATTDYLLPSSIVPKSYLIKLTPYIEPGNFTFDGIVHITAEVVETTNNVVLHINEITYTGITMVVGGEHLRIINTKLNERYNFLTITLAESLTAGATVEIEIIYAGQLNTAMRGFYRSSYIDDAGNTKWLAATHLEPVGARKMFPCFDEPALKATFVVSVNRPAGYKAISNTRLESSNSTSDGRFWDTFEKTPVMSTYLVALIVSDFKSLEDKENSCATWARPNAIQQAAYALSVMAPLIKFYEKAVGHPYQLPKLDMAALPDFASGAMENWGLLTYKESNMLYDPVLSTTTSKQVIADVISHEISHQWFGDQVSPRWWKYLWLSEGFARYFQYHGTAHVETGWGLESQFIVEQLHSAFGTDGLDTTHPMTHDVYSPSEISSIFDTISYAKAASVLRMVEKTFGSTIFYDALHEYLTERNRSDATPEHLFQAFQAQVDQSDTKLGAPVKTIMDSWTTQGGYPVVDVKISGGVASLSQEQFLLRNPNNVSVNKIWWVPITWASKSKPDFTSTSAKYWLSKDKDSVKLGIGDEWVIFNVQQSGYYRVNYDSASWTRLISLLKSNDSSSIHEVNRASLMDDLLNLGRAGYVDYGIVLSATQYLVNETNYIPWRAAFNGLGYLYQRFLGKDIYELYKTHVLTLIKPVYEKLGFIDIPDEPYFDKLLRRDVVIWACEFGHVDCVSSSMQYFADWKSHPSTKRVPVDLQKTIYCTAIKQGSADDWEFLWKQYLSATVTSEKLVILSALGCSNNTEVLEKFMMSAIIQDSGIRFQDSTTVFSSVYTSTLLGADYTLNFVERHYKMMHDYYGDYSKIESILSAVSSRFSTKELVLKFEKFVERQESNMADIQTSLQKSLARAHEDLIWYNTYSPRIFEWLDRTYPSESYRLPKKILPKNYDIYVKPHLDEGDFTFDGEVRIDMEVQENTSSIVLLANELKIKEIKVYIDSVNFLTVSSYNINETTHKFTIYLTTIVIAGSKLSTNIIYTGILNDKMKGFYRSSYVDKTGKTRWMASTQFEPVHARQAFPSFDEPAFKAKFIINIERPDEYHTLSNMPLINSVPSDKLNHWWDSFEESKLMSSYLVAFVVSELDSLQNDHKNHTVWARPEAVEYGAYGLTIGQKVLKFLESYTGIDFPIRKMDLVAVPDFSAGAMENWGLITFREYGLLYHENVTSATYKRYLNTAVAHETVHMWFGDLVTCDWWDYIWLHEGFAQYLEWIVSDSTEPQWNLLQQFVVYELQVAMETDGSPTIHPMNNKVAKPLDIANSFDKITYSKSASVIRMMHHSFGSKIFESALHTYLDSHQYSNAKPDDLWTAIQVHESIENSLGNLNVSIKTLMDSWANQAGFPVVQATWTAGLLTLVQERFLLSKLKDDSKELKNEFWIPVSMTTKSQSNFSDTRPSFWFGTKRYNMPLILKPDEWFILNIQQAGYYRVNYDKASWTRLAIALKSENFDGIHEINRAQIIDDLLNLARTDYVDYDTALWTTKYLNKEENHLPWKAFFNGIAFLNQRFDGHTIAQDFADYVLSLTQRVYEKVGFTDVRDEDQLFNLNRQLILSWTCKLRHSTCMETSKNLFDEWRKDVNKWISPNARPAVYCTALREGTYEDWEFLWNQYKETDFSSEKVVILNALGCTRNTTILNNYLSIAISSDNVIRDQDVATVFSSVYNADQFGVDAALSFLVDNYKDVYKYYGSWSSVAGLFSNVAGKLSTQEQIDKLQAFAEKPMTDDPEMWKSIQDSVAVAKENLEWFNSHSKAIHMWLTKEPEEKPKPGGDGGDSEGGGGSGITKHSICLVIASFYIVINY